MSGFGITSASPLANGYGFFAGTAARMNAAGPSAAEFRKTEDAFADLLVSRTSQDGLTAETDGSRPSASQEELKSSLSGAVDYVAGKYGQEAAAAVMGIVLKRAGEQVDETGLGDGLLQAISFMDRNFGVSAGDDFMSNLNHGLNSVMNDYFGNGHNEMFYAVENGLSSGTVVSSLSGFVAKVQDQFGTDAADMVGSIIDQALSEGGYIGLDARKGVQDSMTRLGGRYGQDSLGSLTEYVNQNFSLSGQQSMLQPPASSGVLLNLTV